MGDVVFFEDDGCGKGTDKLCKLLYEGKVPLTKYTGGGDAIMLHDAAKLIKKLTKTVHTLKVQHESDLETIRAKEKVISELRNPKKIIHELDEEALEEGSLAWARYVKENYEYAIDKDQYYLNDLKRVTGAVINNILQPESCTEKATKGAPAVYADAEGATTVSDVSDPGYCKNCKRHTLRVTDIKRSVESLETLGATTVSLPGSLIEYTRTCDCGYTQELKKLKGDPKYYIISESLSADARYRSPASESFYAGDSSNIMGTDLNVVPDHPAVAYNPIVPDDVSLATKKIQDLLNKEVLKMFNCGKISLKESEHAVKVLKNTG